MMLFAQAAGEAVKSSSYVSGQFVLDGVLLIALLKTTEFIIGKIRPRANGRGPKPGEAKVCDGHTKAIEEQGKAIVALETKDVSRKEALDLMRSENADQHREINKKLGDVLLILGGKKE